MALTKTQIVNAIHKKVFPTRIRASKATEHLLEIMKKTLESGENVMISGFGKFCVHTKKARRGRNPATREPMMLRARKVVTFKSSTKLVEKLNGKK